MNNNFLYGNSERLFLNTNLGCDSNCSYCYLPDLNLKKSQISTDELLELLENGNDFIKGKNGTILSIGCYSECWDNKNRKDTINLINKLLKYENPIQISTKQQITPNEFRNIDINRIKYYNNLIVYISSVSISQHNLYEKGTTEPLKRFSSFEIKEKYNIQMFLYLKPIIDNVTIKDLDSYMDIIQKYNIEAIVGKLFETSGRILAPITSGALRYSDKKQNDHKYIFDILKKYTKVYESSIEPILGGVTNAR
ncbi:MAG: hypothetical protein L3J44_03045 [Campylobacteraceae bacterium]|nr:hypothetical protein [Campylobacteraceae bacterium]